MSSPYFFFRPILAADRSWTGIDWQSSAGEMTDATDFVRCFSESSAAPLADLLPMVVPVRPELERGEQADGPGTNQIVFVLPIADVENAEAVAQFTALRACGNRLAVQLDRADLLRKVPINAFEFLRIEAAFARQELSTMDFAYIETAGLRTIATNVASYEMFDWLSAKGFDWYDSHFLTARSPDQGKEPDLTRLKLLKLLALVRNDGDTREIEAIFREEPKLSYNLLRLVNSVAVGARTKISNFSQAIAILGRRQLQRWLQLLVYANNLADGNAPNPLMQLAAARGRQMELLSIAIEPRPQMVDLSDNAFMTGLFSLLDVLLNLPMSEILKELPVHNAVVEALEFPFNDGALGQLLAAIVAGESGDFSTAEAILSRLGIAPQTHAQAQVTALYWASRINMDNHD